MQILMAGALGEVGRTVSAALANRGHSIVPVSSRAPILGSTAVSLSKASGLLANNWPDIVIIASSRGDHRGGDNSSLNVSEVLASKIVAKGTPAVLLSTLRVLEGYSHPVPEDAIPRPTTSYSMANANMENQWLGTSGVSGSVLRISNYFCLPAAIDSPQAQLLPWSLVTEACSTGSITVQSGSQTAREFVSAEDVARAIEIMVVSRPTSRICSTLPGRIITLSDLVLATNRAFAATQRPIPTASFGMHSKPFTSVISGWLSTHGWISALTQDELVEGMIQWMKMSWPESDHHY